jgi:phenylalanyl-tRNA synthetase beta chain
VQRDISIVVDDAVPVQMVIDQVRSLSRSDDRLSALREFRLFDVYHPRPDSSKIAGASANALLNKEKSLAFRLVLQDTDRSLNDADADAALGAIIEVLKQRCGARLRQ